VAPTLSVRLAHANPVLVRLAQSQPLQGHMGWHTSWHDNAGCTDAERELRWMDIRLALLTAEREAYNGPLFERWNEAHNAAADNHGAVRRLQESAAAQRAEVTRLVAGGVNPSAAEEGLDKVERELRHRTARCEILEAREATAKDAVERAATVAVLSVRKTETARVQQELGEVRAALQATVGQLLARLLVLQQVASLLERSRP